MTRPMAHLGLAERLSLLDVRVLAGRPDDRTQGRATMSKWLSVQPAASTSARHTEMNHGCASQHTRRHAVGS